MLSASLLGSITAVRDGRNVELGSPTQRTVFAVLAAHGNRVVSRGELVRAVWGADVSDTALNSVYTYIARLRKALEPDRPRSAQSELLVSDSLGYMLRISSGQVDARQFRRALAAARTLRAENDLEGAIGRLEAGLALWRGTAYAGAIGSFAESERASLAESRLMAIEDQAEMLLELGRPAEAVGELSVLVHQYPLRERLRLLLMRCHIKLGRQADAVGEYHQLRLRLAEEQGIEPGHRLRELYESVLHVDQPHKVPAPRRRSSLPLLPRDTGWFTGRVAELDRLKRLVGDAAQAGTPAPLLLLTGPPGVGKTALATHLARSLADRFPDGQYQLDLRGFSGHGEPLSAQDALRRLTAEPADGRAGPGGLDPEGLYLDRMAGRRMLLVLDNAASAEQVRPLLPGTESSLVVVTGRARLSGLIAREGAWRCVVPPLAPTEARRLISGIAGASFVSRHENQVNRLIRRCEGLPLALRIAATQIAVSPFPADALRRLCAADLSESLFLPGDEDSRLSTVFGWSCARLPPEALHLYRVLGRYANPETTLDVAAERSGMAVAECLRALEVLVDSSLLQEVAPDHFRMTALQHAHARRFAREGETVA
ncbi:BTAD domain-containing putative transcriptional regulator [Streptomyces sp. NPDC059752]|uniref:AfsR/SARP family transcriptional regulator n=1 Tax=unclassified Streptomyces TaxID=2593676 RepID=UPI0036672189